MKWCLYARRCPWGNACHPGYCAIEEDGCVITHNIRIAHKQLKKNI